MFWRRRLQLAVMTARLANGGYAVTPRLIVAEQPAGYRTVIEPGVGPVPPHGFQAGEPETDRGRHVGRHQRDRRHRLLDPHCRGRHGDGGQDRHLPGAPHHEGRTRARHSSRTKTCPGTGATMRCSSLMRRSTTRVSPVSVIVEHGGGGSRVAAPIAKEILLETQKRYSGAAERADLDPFGGWISVGRRRASGAARNDAAPDNANDEPVGGTGLPPAPARFRELGLDPVGLSRRWPVGFVLLYSACGRRIHHPGPPPRWRASAGRFWS